MNSRRRSYRPMQLRGGRRQQPPAVLLAAIRVGAAAVGAAAVGAGAVMGGGDVGLAVSWSADGAWLLVSARVSPLTEQLAAWRPGDTVLHVPRRQLPTGQHPAAAG